MLGKKFTFLLKKTSDYRAGTYLTGMFYNSVNTSTVSPSIYLIQK